MAQRIGEGYEIEKSLFSPRSLNAGSPGFGAKAVFGGVTLAAASLRHNSESGQVATIWWCDTMKAMIACHAEAWRYTRRVSADYSAQRDKAQQDLDAMIESMSFDTTL